MSKHILISADAQEYRAAVVEDGVLQEFYVERTATEQLVGSVFKGRVSSVVPGIGAAFIDIGLSKNGFLYVSDIVAGLGDDVDVEDNGGASVSLERRRRQETKIESLLQVGQDVMVQVVKEPLGTKGARLTSQISLPGRHLVFMPTEHHIGVSKRIESGEERGRVRGMLREIRGQRGGGFIVRTAAAGLERADFEREVRFLYSTWERIQKAYRGGRAPAVVYSEYDLAQRTVRDHLTGDVERIVVDSKVVYRQLAQLIGMLVPTMRSQLHLYQNDAPLFEQERIEEDVAKLYDPEVRLPSGGSVVIQPTESMIAIDVNTARFTGRRNLEETAFQTNLEAAREIARQLRLRDLGGIIVIDFIDMDTAQHRREIYRELEQALRRDRSKTNIVSYSELCLIEMTRQRMRRSLVGVSHQPCSYCDGRGVIKSPVTVAIGATRCIVQFMQGHRRQDVMVTAHPMVAAQLLRDGREQLVELEHRYRGRVSVLADPNVHLEDVRVGAVQA